MARRVHPKPRATRVPDIRKGDEVLILSGKDAGKRGTVDRVVRNAASIQKVRNAAAVGRCRGAQHRQEAHQAAHQPGSQRPLASHPAGRHRPGRQAAGHQQRDDRLPQLPSADARAPHGDRQRRSRACLQSLRRRPRARGEVVSGQLRQRYREEVVPALQKEFEYANPMQVPRLQKIVINIGLGEALTNAKALDAAVGDLATIAGQKPVVTRARRSIAQFRVRAGNPIGAKVTLRGERMWDFLERLTRLALPRIRDFRGVPSRSFDGRGNYSLGLREQLAFPEIDYDKVDKLRGLEISIVTTAKTDEESKKLLQLLGMPFAG
jgi:large subunit ribosomal protein L5